MNGGGVAESCSGCFVLLIGTILEMDRFGQNRRTESELRFGGLGSPRISGLVKGEREGLWIIEGGS